MLTSDNVPHYNKMAKTLGEYEAGKKLMNETDK